MMIGAAIALLGALIVHVMAPILAWQWTRQPFIGALLEHTLVVGTVQETWGGRTTEGLGAVTLIEETFFS